MGRKTWVAGDVLTAADLMAYLMNQAIDVCTSASRPSSPTEGMFIYETDTDRFLRYDGSGWVGVLSSVLRVTGTSGTPALQMKETNASTDEKLWDFVPNGGALLGRLLNDAEDDANNWLTVTRSGDTPTLVQFDALVRATSGIDVQGSPSGYPSGEVRFPTDSGAGDWYAISTAGQSSPTMSFDHRGAANTGVWRWRNGTSAADTRMTLTAAGVLQPGSDVQAGGKVTGTAESGGNHVSFVDNDNHSWESNGTGGWRFANRGGTAASLFTFVGGDDTIELARITDPGGADNAAMWLAWQAHDGTHYFKQVRCSQSGDIDGTTRRYLYVVES